ncbi:MAG: SpoIID/LytB domain-containing protein [Deltaproteobacteria bacterium]|nr:SpoIID/LytB domain-containing protein [Deltaproteobacteria bacterium]
MEYPSPKDGGLPQNSIARFSPRRLRSELLLVVIFLAVTLGIVVFCSTALAAPVPVVRVMVDREPATLKINGFDLLVTEADTSRSLAHENRRASVNVKCSLGGRMEVSFGGAKGRMRASGPLKITSLGGFLRVGQSQYRDELYVYSFNGDCIVVNHVDLEKYVAGLLNSEMSASWSLNALTAQAIAARTYAIYQMKEAGTTRYKGFRPPFDLDSSVRDQVYEGAQMERYKALQAVQRTRGMVLSYHGEPIKAFYHSTCGGRTETPERVWGVRLPYLRSVECGYCNKSPRFNWVYSIPGGDLETKLRRAGLLRGRLAGIRIVARNRLGRASRVEVRGTENSVTVAATRIRDVVGTVNLRSTDFTVGRNPAGGARGGEFVFIGHGSGHGVGMCQYGAKAMGEQGQSYAQILKHYYPEAQITKYY